MNGTAKLQVQEFRLLVGFGELSAPLSILFNDPGIGDGTAA